MIEDLIFDRLVPFVLVVLAVVNIAAIWWMH